MKSNVIKNLLLCTLLGTTIPAFATKEDRLNLLIQKVGIEKQMDGNSETTENQLLGRASWSIKCEYRVFDDIKACLMTKGPVTVARVNNKYFVYVGDNHAKKSITQLRVDNNLMFQGSEGYFKTGSMLIDEFKKGYFVYTRYEPKGKNKVENKLSLLGFTSAYNDMESRFNRIKTY